jgi:hypothetical protein
MSLEPQTKSDRWTGAGLARFDLRKRGPLVAQIVLGGVAVAAIVRFEARLVETHPAAGPHMVAALPPLDTSRPSDDTAAGPPSVWTPVPRDLYAESEDRLAPQPSAPLVEETGKAPLPPLHDLASRPTTAPLPPRRPLEIGLPPTRPLGPASRAAFLAAAGYDHWTAVYDIVARMVYLPDGTRLEAHSGLGDRLDDPRFVSEHDRGATPPHLYDLELREGLFHGVQALRLTPVGDGDVYGRTGLLAHPYMLGPSGDSNGCVSFKDYDAFLRAFQSGQVKRLAVVAALN